MQVTGLSQLWPAQHPVCLEYNMQELSLATPGLAECSQALSSLFFVLSGFKKAGGSHRAAVPAPVHGCPAAPDHRGSSGRGAEGVQED